MIIGRTESIHLVISWLALGFAFSVRELFSPLSNLSLAFGISLLTVGTGFILHELAHKFVAQRYGYWAEFRLSPMGLVTAVFFALATRGTLIFAAPGATFIIPKSYHFGQEIESRESAIVSLAGPLTNIGLAFAFLLIPPGSLLATTIGQWGFTINLWLAAFNMLPFGGLDGQKVLEWNKLVWLVAAGAIWILVARFLFFLF